MNASPPRRFSDPEACVDATLARLGKRIVLGLPVGLGKPIPFVNAMVRRACGDSSMHLTILTALSFRVPKGRSDLERRLVDPLAQRLFGDSPPLEYVALLETGRLPPNIEVTEFFLEPGAWIGNDHLQQHYLSANYTHVIRDALARGLNVLAQMVAMPGSDDVLPGQLSLSCNPDLTVDLLPHIAAMRANGKPFALIGALHRDLPFMYGDAVVPEDSFDFLIDPPDRDTRLFSPPNPAIDATDHMIGLAVSALVKDGGTLQLGIGELGDAVVHGLLLRQQKPAIYREALGNTGLLRSAGTLIETEGGTTPFDRGLYACSEMLVDGFLDLHEGGILKRHVYPSARIQQLLDEGSITETLDASCMEALHEAGVRRLSYVDFQELRDVGVLRDDVRFENGMLITPQGVGIPVNLEDPASRAAIATHCLGSRLRNGSVLDAGFFFGPASFYTRLRAMPVATRKRFGMRGISFINELFGPELELKSVQRRHARFVNTTMMMTALGNAVSDGLADGRMVSGVGGQYNFVAMAHMLPGARSILCLRSTRSKAGAVSSNILWNYGHTTIPRHLRDIVVTEYGIADLRSKTDSEIIAALVDVMDARFQESLVRDAQRTGKLPASYRIPDRARGNIPQRIAEQLRPFQNQALFSKYPFGSDLTAEEQALGRALLWLNAATSTPAGKSMTVVRALLSSPAEVRLEPLLARMGLDHPTSLKERLLQKLVIHAIRGAK
ncbi:MAG: acetyl-CoA hydrolase/transferase C-terminal domain-containing protein [Steroidobacteraceae bacterium]